MSGNLSDRLRRAAASATVRASLAGAVAGMVGYAFHSADAPATAAVTAGLAAAASARALFGPSPGGGAREMARAALSRPARASAKGLAGDPLGFAMLDALPVGLLLLDAEGRIDFENAAAREILERSVAGRRSAAEFRAPALREAVAGALEAGRESEAEVAMGRAKERVVHVVARPLPRRPGSPAAMLMLEDRTRIARGEEQRRDFIANASHELKTPLAALTGFIETLQGHARTDPEAAERFLGIMEKQAERMRRLVEDLLSLDRIEANEHVRPRGPIDLRDAAREAVSAVASLAGREKVELRLALGEAPMIVRGDAEELAQLFRNLVENAVKYAGAGGPVEIAAARDDASRPGMIGLVVADSGPGIAREHLPRLTERFYRVDVARSRERGGTGLGLAIAKHIVNRHRGELAIASEPGEGARFTVWMPEARGEAI